MPRKNTDTLNVLKKKHSRKNIDQLEPRTTKYPPPDIPSRCIIHGGLFVVDFFRNHKRLLDECIYVLTHYHTDHYQGLSKKWTEKKLLMTSITKNLVVTELEVDPQLITTIEYGQTLNFEKDGFLWEVTCYDANHCPGAAMFHFVCSNPTIKNTFHTGDFRYFTGMKLPSSGDVQIIHLDNTFYKDAHYDFPLQSQIFSFINNYLEKFFTADDIVMLAVYRLGKDKMIRAIHDKFQQKFTPYLCDVDYIKRAEIAGFADVLNPVDTPSKFYVVPLHKFSLNTAKSLLANIKGRVIMIKGSGWNIDYKKSVMRLDDRVVLHNVAYSEHSSYSEVKEFLTLFPDAQIINTVPENNNVIRNLENFLNQ